MAANPACVGHHRAQDPIQMGSPCKVLPTISGTMQRPNTSVL